MLYNPIIFIGRFYHFTPLVNVMCRRFFYIDILTGLASPNRLKCMPMVRSCQSDSINPLIIIDLPKVLLDSDCFSIFAFHFFGSLLQNVHIGVTQCSQFHIIFFGNLHNLINMILPTPINSQHCYTDTIVCSFSGIRQYFRSSYHFTPYLIWGYSSSDYT